MVHNVVTGLTALHDPLAIAMLVIGSLVGVFIGVLPGLGVAMVLSIMLAFIYHIGVVPAIALMLATQAGSYFSASITAILLNTPGAPESMAVTFDGFPMARRGEAARALGISATSTCIGGLVGCAALLGLIQIVKYLPEIFRAPDSMAIILLAVVLTGGLGSDSLPKALLSAAFGLTLSFIGNDPVSGAYRFTFNNAQLYGGISVIPVALGMFAIPQMIHMYGSDKGVSSRATTNVGVQQFGPQVLQGIRDTFEHTFLLVRSAIIGVVCGMVPGIGGFAANFISYGTAQQTSKRSSEFGTGIPEGIIAPEASSLAKEAGSLVPAIGLGLPSGLGMVLFLAALSILGLQPGPHFLSSEPSLPYTMMWVVALAGVFGTIAGLLAAPLLARITRVRGPFLLPFVAGLAVVGSYAVAVSRYNVGELIIFSVVGLTLRRLKFSVASITIGLVLGAQFDDEAFLTRQVFGWRFLERPLTDFILVFTVAVLILQTRRTRKKGRTSANTGFEDSNFPHPWLELIATLGFIALFSTFLVIASGYTWTAKLVPMVVMSVGLVVAAVKLVGDIRLLMHPPALVAAESLTAAGPKLGEGGVPLVASARQPDTAGQATIGAEGPLQVGAVGALAVAVGERRAGPPLHLDETNAEIRARLRVQYRREAVAFGWVLLLVVMTFVLPFQLAVPLVVFLYGATAIKFQKLRNRIMFAVVSAAIMAAVTTELFQVLHLG